ncbi:MAG: hypothetical protein ACE5GE_05010 [Phycisphaerae bacterium]
MTGSPEKLERRGGGWMDVSLWQRHVAGVLGVYLAAYLLIDTGAIKYTFLLTPDNNLNVAEARAWLDGRLDLAVDRPDGKRPWDSALFEGKVYNVFPPAFTMIAAGVMKAVPDGVPSIVLILLVVPLPGLAYLVFWRRVRRVGLAVLISIGYLLGTSLLPVANHALRNGEVWLVNHLLSQVGLLVFLADFFGRRRIWLGGLGLILAAWSRQLTGAYLIGLVYVAVAAYRVEGKKAGLVWAGLVGVVLVAVPATLNAMKFHSPVESGYRYIYEGRWDDPSDAFAQRAGRGLFSPAFVPRNVYYMNLGLPVPDEPWWLLRFTPNTECTGIWWTTPLLLWVWVDWRRVWGQVELRWLLVPVGLVYAALMLFHTTGADQLGYNRFSLDFVPVLLAVVAPGWADQKRRGVALGLVLWSVWYFRWAI